MGPICAAAGANANASRSSVTAGGVVGGGEGCSLRATATVTRGVKRVPPPQRGAGGHACVPAPCNMPFEAHASRKRKGDTTDREKRDYACTPTAHASGACRDRRRAAIELHCAPAVSFVLTA